MVLDQLQKDSNDIMNLIKKERNERERDSNVIKERIDNERKELQVGTFEDFNLTILKRVLIFFLTIGSISGFYQILSIIFLVFLPKNLLQ